MTTASVVVFAARAYCYLKSRIVRIPAAEDEEEAFP
jgi:hypothetical protein